jgi:putative resolvase
MEKLLTIGQVAKQLNVTIKTLRLWDEKGKLVAIRTPGRHRMYRESDIEKFIGIFIENKSPELPVCTYCRVSSHDQKQKGDLERQEGRVLSYCIDKGYSIGYSFAEVGSGMSDTRAKLLKVFKLATEKKISKLIIEHQDRLCRFNFEIFKLFLESHGVQVEYMGETLPKTYEAELVEDMLSLMSSFSARIYGKRSAERRKKK